jgi:hypothetical protein
VTVSPYGDLDGYVFEGSAGDTVIIQMHKASGSFYPDLRLFAPNDSLVVEIWGTASHQKIEDYSLPYTGTYTVLASDHPGNKIGDYWLRCSGREVRSHAEFHREKRTVRRVGTIRQVHICLHNQATQRD